MHSGLFSELMSEMLEINGFNLSAVILKTKIYSLVLFNFFTLCDLGSHYGLCHNEASLGQKDLLISPNKPIINS